VSHAVCNYSAKIGLLESMPTMRLFFVKSVGVGLRGEKCTYYLKKAKVIDEENLKLGSMVTTIVLGKKELKVRAPECRMTE
jgi:hypothetical protein